MSLRVKEIFYSLQGEGGRQGEASIFIRLADCNLRCDFCDTDFTVKETMLLEQILEQISQYPCLWIVWTGGEPMLQLTDEIVLFFKEKGFLQAIESNGHYWLPENLDYKVISPKGKSDYAKKINPQADEIRLPIQKGDIIPNQKSLPEARFYFLSPVFTDDKTTTKANIDYCVEQIKQHPEWCLSLQIHKLIGIE
ncbi:7-carboxy-7-deazaguanine synthase [Bacteroidia bacterium]|nr:7-carboxy-7-deazaguanine synthase [Bacteroidia bacterium]